MSEPFALVPHPRTPLVGRDAELRKIVELVANGCALLTITGTGGVGKTRLALTAAHDLRETFGDRVVFVELAGVNDHRDVADALASALRVRIERDGSINDALISALGLRRTLLVVDNLEHVLEAGGLIGHLVESAPLLSVVATSRARLGLAAEIVFALDPLPTDSSSAAAIELFVTRACAVRPSFVVDESNAHAIVELCRWLDGLPLAVELAASRVALLEPDMLLSRLRGSTAGASSNATGLRLLASGEGDRPPRHRAVHDAIRWSVELLTPKQQTLLGSLAVFEGGWTLDAAEAVGQNDDLDALSVLDSLDALLRHNLVVRDGPAPFGASPAGDPPPQRYRMLETIRQFAAALTDQTDRPRERHAVYFVDLVKAARDGLESAAEAVWTARLEQEDANIRAAVLHLEQVGDVHGCLALASALGRHWRNSGRWDTGRAWLTRHFEAALGTDPPLEVVVDALGWIGRLAIEDGVAGDDRKGLEEAIGAIDEGLALARDVGDPRLLLRAMEAVIAAGAADAETARQARHVCAEALALSIEIEDRWWQAMLESWRGVQLRLDGDLATAESAATTCRALACRDGNRHMAGLGGWVLSSVLIESRRFSDAETVLREAIDDNLSSRDRRSAAFCHLSMGSIAMARADLPTAAEHLRDGLLLAHESSDWVGAGFGVMSLLSLASRTGQHQAGAVIWGGIRHEVEALCRSYPSQRHAVDRAMESARSELGDSAFDLLAHQGQQRGRHDSTHEALAVAETVLAAATPGATVTTEPPSESASMRPANPDRLSPREIEVLRLIPDGFTNQQIGHRLFLSIGTVERHVANVYRKIGARRRADAAAYALRNGFGS